MHSPTASQTNCSFHINPTAGNMWFAAKKTITLAQPFETSWHSWFGYGPLWEFVFFLKHCNKSTDQIMTITSGLSGFFESPSTINIPLFFLFVRWGGRWDSESQHLSSWNNPLSWILSDFQQSFCLYRVYFYTALRYRLKAAKEEKLLKSKCGLS